MAELNGKLFVVDPGTHDIKIFNSDGTFQKSFGTKGKGPSDLLSPLRICASKGRIIVWEVRNRRFSYFTESGQFIKIESPKLKGRLEELKTLNDGRIVLGVNKIEPIPGKKDAFEQKSLQLYSGEMKFIKTLYRQKERRFRYFKQRTNGAWRVVRPYSTRLLWDTLPGSRIVVGFPAKYEFKIIDVDTGKEQTITQPGKPQAITKPDEEFFFSMQSHMENGRVKQGAGKFYRDNAEFPEYFPAYKALTTDKEGHIFIFFYQRINGKPSYHSNYFDLFESNGKFINRITIKGTQALQAPFWFIWPAPSEFWSCRSKEKGSEEFVWVKYK